MSRNIFFSSIVAASLSLGVTACDSTKEETKTAEKSKEADKAKDPKAKDPKAKDLKAKDPKAEMGAVADKATDKQAADKNGKAAPGGDVLVGTWTLDPTASKEMEDYKKASGEKKAQMDAMMKAVKMEITFTADTMKTHTEMGDQKKEDDGKYVVKGSEGKMVTIESEVDGKKETITVEVDGSKLTIERAGQKMVFNKKA